MSRASAAHGNIWRTRAAIVLRGRIQLMDSWTATTRHSPIDHQQERQGLSTTAAAAVAAGYGSPLPQHAGDYSCDRQTLSQRRLPPLYTPSCGASAEALAVNSLHLPVPAYESSGLGKSRPRSQSLFDVFQPPNKRQRHDSPGKVDFPFAIMTRLF